MKKPAEAGTFGGVVKLAAISKPGTYEVTLSREAWVDVIQNQARARSLNISRQRDCETMRKEHQVRSESRTRGVADQRRR